ncbi:Hypp5168 [Branchiostoma lanceolatum]|uniref:Hypp5168 protein n=1 Tax=Branchiostoma lanceolatum TaxID=7740 RepID=A0A8K0ACX9_BRALA|nr:Hypp5168 [Branchiostoma lanceolatum]
MHVTTPEPPAGVRGSMADDPYTGDPLDVYRKPDKQFTEETVGIASTLLEKKVTLGRPPSATMRNRKAAILNELSSAKSTSKHKAFYVPSPPAVRKDTAKPNLPNRKVRSAQARYSTGGKQKWEGRKVKSAQSSYTQHINLGAQKTQDRRPNFEARNTRSKQQTFHDFREDLPHRTPPAYEEVVDSSTSQLSNFFFKTELEEEEEDTGVGLDPYRLVGSTAECFPYKCATPGNQGSEQDKGRQQDELYVTARKVPSGIQPLTPWLTEDIPPEWCGVDPKECLVFLPSLRMMDSPPPYIPPMQSPEDELPFTDILPPTKPQNPKRQQRVRDQRRHSEGHETPQFGAVQNVEIFSKSDGSLLHASNERKKSMKEIRKEIDELDSILQGMEREETDRNVVQQQDSMDDLKHFTNKSPMRSPEAKAEGITHMQELKEYTEECEEVLASIRKQRQKSLQELAQLHPALANRKLSL